MKPLRFAQTDDLFHALIEGGIFRHKHGANIEDNKNTAGTYPGSEPTWDSRLRRHAFRERPARFTPGAPGKRQ